VRMENPLKGIDMAHAEDGWAEMESLLNAKDARRTQRRKPHHLPDEWYSTTTSVYCVTLCARHHGTPFVSRALADSTVGALRYYRDRGLCLVYAYCLMPDHLHAIMRLRATDLEAAIRWDADATAPPTDLKKLISNYKRYTTTQVAWKQGLHGRLWQRDFYDHIARGEEEFGAQCRYVLENPVRRDLVVAWTEYPWSGVMDEWE
jgi:putative transposase